LLGATALSAVVVFGLEAIVWLRQHIYEATHSVHIVDVAGDWESLFVNIGFAVVLGALGAILLARGIWNRWEELHELVEAEAAHDEADDQGARNSRPRPVVSPHTSARTSPPRRCSRL
jgi:hypothetical protein